MSNQGNGPAPFLHARLVDSCTPLPQPQILRVPHRGPSASHPQRPRQETGWRAAGEGGGQPCCQVGQQPSPPPSSAPAERKGRGCIQINSALMGRQAGARFPAGSHLGRRRWTLRGRGPHSGLEPRSPRLQSGRLLCLRVLGSRARSRTPGVCKPARSGSAEPAARTPGRAVPRGPPLPWQRRCSLAGSPARGLRKPAPGSRVRPPPLYRGERGG